MVITEGFPSTKASLPDSLQRFWSIKDHLSIDDDLIVYCCCLLIPTSLRATMLSRLHDAHQGIACSQARARLTIYWPGIDQDIEAFVQGCCHCQDHLPSNVKEPMLSKQIPDRPFQVVAVDFASYSGKQFLIILDYKTDWPDIIEMGKDTTVAKLSTNMRDYFQVGNHVAVQNPTSKLWDIYGTITAVGLYRRYFIKTQSGTFLVRNQRFI